MTKNKKIFVNVLSSAAVLTMNVCMRLFLSPYIIENVGVEANGFVTLANNFITYAQLMVTALNSMAARFITISYAKKDYEKANIYYNSVFWGNLIIVAVLLGPVVGLIYKLEYVLDIPSNIVLDVKILFSFVFFNFFFTTALPNWECGTYVSNRLDLKYSIRVVAEIVRGLILIVFFSVWNPHIYYVGFAASTAVIIMTFCDMGFTKKLTPELRVGWGAKRKCSWLVIKELVGAGIWNSISDVGNLLLNGLDLLIADVFIGSVEMGVMAVAKVLSFFVRQFSDTVRGVFMPELIISYASGDKERLLKDITRDGKIVSILSIVPLAGVIVMGEDFYRLWVPSQDAHFLAILSSGICIGLAFSMGVTILYNVFTVVNRVKENAISMIICGVITTVIVFLVVLIKPEYGLYAVAWTSVAVCFVRNLVYTVPYAAVFLGYKKTQFFPQIFMGVISTIIITVVGSGIRYLFRIDGWGDFCICVVLIGTVGYIINFMIFLNKEEKKYLLNMVKSKLKI